MADRYHHGNLRAALITAATQQLSEQGLEQLTLRKLADKIGVSRTSAYHHFANKNALVCAVAAEGFEQLSMMMPAQKTANTEQCASELRRFVEDYIAFASAQPDLYELMFGRTIWRVGTATDELKTVAYACFASYNAWVLDSLLQHNASADKTQALRIAQANWAAIHGLCRLSLDGVYMASSDLSGVVDEVVATIQQRVLG